ncbi:LOW QUALITY PROTEIN: hypothetical protein BT93_L2868 [Corymbia citriodora subsp. variegata]|uniref:FLZ-type domain-containing protein n=1 Tax=Corymbia citriodora subsp. variegata TaxID=360336 RepID=A0A8T0CL64_CORYI|nr:LOW QUALITY PROTEIN: hypothetical protein BT93_L2868 [Corymbia citriodora subsp. variegata]
MDASPRAAMLYHTRCEDRHYEPHFIQSCFLCNKPLGFNSDIFMYRSAECQQEWIEIDEVKEKNWKSSPLSRSSSSSSSSFWRKPVVQEQQGCRSGTVAVA